MTQHSKGPALMTRPDRKLEHEFNIAILRHIRLRLVEARRVDERLFGESGGE
ncbi:hypothetical protein ABIA27_001274 [Sinorhizobium fredii]